QLIRFFYENFEKLALITDIICTHDTWVLVAMTCSLYPPPVPPNAGGTLVAVAILNKLATYVGSSSIAEAMLAASLKPVRGLLIEMRTSSALARIPPVLTILYLMRHK